MNELRLMYCSLVLEELLRSVHYPDLTTGIEIFHAGLTALSLGERWINRSSSQRHGWSTSVARMKGLQLLSLF